MYKWLERTAGENMNEMRWLGLCTEAHVDNLDVRQINPCLVY